MYKVFPLTIWSLLNVINMGKLIHSILYMFLIKSFKSDLPKTHKQLSTCGG